MTFYLTSTELAEVREFGNEQDYPSMYEAIADDLTNSVDPAQGSYDQGALLWFQGTALINQGVGPAATFIRTYTQAELDIRGFVGDPSSASNAIAKSVFQDISRNGAVPDLHALGEQDAGATTQQFFHDQG